MVARRLLAERAAVRGRRLRRRRSSATTWPGLDEFFVPGQEIFVSRSADDTLALLRTLPDEARLAAAERARARVVSAHTAAHRAAQLESALIEIRDRQRVG